MCSIYSGLTEINWTCLTSLKNQQLLGSGEKTKSWQNISTVFLMHWKCLSITNLFFFFSQEFTMHDTIGCYLDTEKGQIKFSKNGKFYSLFLEFYLDAFTGGQGGRGTCTLAESDWSNHTFREGSWPCIWNPTTYKEPSTFCSLCTEGNRNITDVQDDY